MTYLYKVDMQMLKHDGVCFRKGDDVGKNRLIHYHGPDRWYNLLDEDEFAKAAAIYV